MKSEIKFCPNCAITGKNMVGSTSTKNTEFGKGYIIGWDEEISSCPFCHESVNDINITVDDYMVIRNVSNYNRQFLDAMISLHEKDIIEYELKMSQLRNQVEQKQTIQKQQDNSSTIKCPYCHSDNVKKITASSRVGSAMMFGILSKKIGKQWHCNDCKSDF